MPNQQIPNVTHLRPFAILNGVPCRRFSISWENDQIDVTYGGLFGGEPDKTKTYIAGRKNCKCKLEYIYNKYISVTNAEACKVTIGIRPSGRQIYNISAINSYTYIKLKERHEPASV